ncbi:MAG UNVERIFIED_CONTAM: hypothetical protein LVR18_06285 [Planctomycetaceae bacterium]|jgi:glycine/D-amino acid oxidase-like deaminating enzyme
MARSQPDILIIGGGVIGLTIAFELAQQRSESDGCRSAGVGAGGLMGGRRDASAWMRA